MKKRYILLAVVLIAAAVYLNVKEKAPAAADEVYVFAAASLTDALEEICREYEKTSNDEILLNFGGSGSLKLQIEEGAPCDLFLSASQEHMDQLEAEDFLAEHTRTDLLKNALTLIASEEAAGHVSLDSLGEDKIKSIAVGTPDSVPAGEYAMQSLEALNFLKPVQPKLIMAKDVRAVLKYVETGNADCGFVYRTDALLLQRGVIAEDLPEDSHEPILYPMAVMKEGRQKEAAERFSKFLKSGFSAEVFEKYGFTVL